MEKEIQINQHIYNELVQLARNSLPAESCALLLGTKKYSIVIVTKILQMNNNSRDSSISFEINPDELLDTYRKSNNLNMDIVSIFHSHPAKPFPSGIDQTYMEINPVIWVIYSTTLDLCKAFFLDGNKKIREIKIYITRE